MVDINPINNSSINLSNISSNSANVNTNADAQLAYSWAVGQGLIQGIDYSAKHYAEQAKQSEEIARESIDSENNAQIWAEGTDEEVQALGGEHSSKGWVNYVLTNPPTAYTEQIEGGATLTVTDIHGTTTTTILNGQNGADGQDGQNGADGYSPAATVTQSGDITTISITDKNGTTTESIDLSDKQDLLVSGANIKTINNQSLLGSGNITIQGGGGGGTVDQTFDGTSQNAQSGVAIQGELSTNYQSKLVSGTNIKTINNTSLLGSGNIDVLQNTATGSNSLTILGSAAGNTEATNIGYGSVAAAYATALGGHTKALGTQATALGFHATVSADYAIQIGYGTNSTARTLSIGFYNHLSTPYNWQLLDGTTGLIPDARISTNIARVSQIPDVLTDDTTVNKNSDDELQAIGVIDDNVQNAYNFTVVGSPTITADGIASGFSSSNYITATKNIDFTKPFVVEGEFATGSNITQQQFIFATTINYAFGLQVFDDRHLYAYYPTTTNSFKKTMLLSANTKYKYRYYYTGNELKLDINDETYTISTSDFNPTIASFINIGISRTASQPFNGSIDLKQFSITVDGKEVYKAWQPPALKYWTGTRTQYDAIVTKDDNTIYNVEDSSTLVVDILNSLYPIGAIYIGTMATCPLSVLGIGTWQLVAQDRVLQGAGTRGTVGSEIDESLPNATITIITETVTAGSGTAYLSASSKSKWKANQGSTASYQDAINFSLNKASSTYQDNAPVQQDGYLVNIWERIA